MGGQVAENLLPAHANNARRFKHLRSGLYMLKVYAYRPGDYVCMVSPKEKVPDGTTGIRVRAEILKVTKLGPPGTLEVINQAGRIFQTHKERVVPCLLPNVEGTTHPGLTPVPRKKPCVICGNH